MANSPTHASVPYPIRGARYSIQIPYLDDDGDPTDPTTPDTEISKDAAAFSDCAEEVTTVTGSNGLGYITLSGAETDCSMLALAAKVASGPKATLLTIHPRVLASVGTGTLSAGSAGGGTLGTLLAYDVTGCFVKTTGGTGGGGTGGANNQVRKIITYNTSTGAFTVTPNWETTPDDDTTYDVLLPEGVTLGMLRALNPTTPGRTLTVESDGVGHADVKEISGNSGGVAGFDRATRAITVGTVDTDATTTSIPTSSLTPAATVANQFIGQIVCFDKDTTTTALRGQKTDITASSDTGTLTTTALTTSPASGDTFTIQ